MTEEVPMAPGAYDKTSGRRPVRAMVAMATGLALGLAVALSPGASAAPVAPPAPAPAKPSQATSGSDVREISPKKTYSTKKLSLKAASKQQRAQAVGETPPVGTTRSLLALDDYEGQYYLKDYTLQAAGDKIEVWVADDTAFPAGDCRNAVANTTTVTRAQAESLAKQFDTNMFPKESAAFSVAPDRDGTNPSPDAAGIDATGDGDKIMTLVDNVRDDNFYTFPAAPTYIAGFFSSQINELLDRNVMTIDAFDWEHRTGANPKDAATADLCTSRPARANLYEGTFAHEYQHLLQYYQDPNEVNWVNEGLSDFAQTLVGYVDATRTVSQKGTDSHIYCYQGFGPVKTKYNPNPRACGGPQNSLTLWGDEGDGNEILADYGEAYSFMLFLYDRYGVGFMSTLHRDGANQGLAGLQDALDANKKANGVDAYKVLHDFQVSTLLDRQVDTKRGKVTGISKKRVTTKSLNSTVNLNNPAAYAAPGAAPNGADYVRLRKSNAKKFLNPKDLKSLSFAGDKVLAAQPLQWTVATNAPEHGSDAALWSGNTSNLDAAAVTEVTVPASYPVLTFDDFHLAEATYDYAYAVISTDGGKTYTALANANTVDAPYGPALNGDSTSWETQTFSLKAYAGQKVIVGFRYVSDGGTNDGGWYVDNVKLGGVLINDGSVTAPFKSRTQQRPTDIYGYTVRLVGYNSDKDKALVRTYTARSFSLKKSKLAEFRKYPRVVAIVSYDEPTEQVQQYAPYALKVNGVLQPGGGKRLK